MYGLPWGIWWLGGGGIKGVLGTAYGEIERLASGEAALGGTIGVGITGETGGTFAK